MIRVTKNSNWENDKPKCVSFEEFATANDLHINDVMDVMDHLAEDIKFRGELHDCTMKSQEQLFYKCYIDSILYGKDFYQSDWYKMHILAERHHLESNCPEDINLIDILESIANCVCSDLSRYGEVKPYELSDDILRKALYNTVEYIKSRTELVNPPSMKQSNNIEENNINNECIK